MEIEALVVDASQIAASLIAVLSRAVVVMLHMSPLRQSWVFLALHLHLPI